MSSIHATPDCCTAAHASARGHRRARQFNLFSAIAAAVAARRQRRDLAGLDDAILRDIGLTRAQAIEEAQRPLWDVPRNWRG